jgi:hypothetical protein
MSRTYRLRHLPTLGTSKKFIDSRAAAYNELFDNQYSFWFSHVLHDFPCKGRTYSGNIDCTYCPPWKYPAYVLIRDQVDRFRGARASAVGPIHNHPWVHWGIAQNSNKKDYRVRGNRSARRATRQKMRHYDPDEDFLPTSKHEWSSWDLW